MVYNKEVSYRKRIARKHSCHRPLSRAKGAVDPVIFFLSARLISVQNLVAVRHTVASGVMCRRSEKSGGAGTCPAHLGRGAWLTPRNTPLSRVSLLVLYQTVCGSAGKMGPSRPSFHSQHSAEGSYYKITKYLGESQTPSFLSAMKLLSGYDHDD